MKGEIRS